MPTVSVQRKIRNLAASVKSTASRIDLTLDVVAPQGEFILTAGGTWSTERLEYVGRPDVAHRVRLVSSQLKAGVQLAQWFRDYERDDPDRQALEEYVDNRRGGKTFFSVLAVLSFALRYPSCHLGKTICWIVVPTYPQQREIHECITHIIPAAWFSDRRIVYHKSDKYYELANGAQIWIKSADRPQSLKAGGVAAIAINEAQQIEARAALNAMGANIDSGGICWLALNPPDSTKGLWLENLHDAINAVDDKGRPVLPWARETRFPSELNEVINQQARTRFGKLAAVIDPKQHQRDSLGLWVSIKDRAYPFYDRAKHYRPAPSGWRDFTIEANNLTGLLNKGDNRTRGAGMDFQRRPWCAFITARCLLSPAGVPVYVIDQEVCNDIAVGQYWTEDMLCLKVREEQKKWQTKPRDYLLVADMTGHHQGSTQNQRGQQADPATFSWAIVEQYGWDPHAPIEYDEFDKNKKGPAEISHHRANPPVAVRLNVINELLKEERIIILPECKTVAESFRQCEVNQFSRKPKGDWSHLTDAVGYLLYAWETGLRENGIVKVAA